MHRICCPAATAALRTGGTRCAAGTAAPSCRERGNASRRRCCSRCQRLTTEPRAREERSRARADASALRSLWRWSWRWRRSSGRLRRRIATSCATSASRNGSPMARRPRQAAKAVRSTILRSAVVPWNRRQRNHRPPNRRRRNPLLRRSDEASACYAVRVASSAAALRRIGTARTPPVPSIASISSGAGSAGRHRLSAATSPRRPWLRTGMQ